MDTESDVVGDQISTGMKEVHGNLWHHVYEDEFFLFQEN